ncbi:MAG: MarC family protein [Ktedonobacterales bacterium]
MQFFFKALVALFTVVDPIGLVPMVLSLTSGLPEEERGRVVSRAVIIAAIVLAGFGVAGHLIFSSLGVTSEAFSIAGGVLLFLIAIDMLFGRQSGTRETPREARDARARDDVSVFPLAIPLIAGPGALVTITLLLDDAQGHAGELAAVAVAAGITLAAAWLSMSISLPIQKRMGTTGILVLSRVLGMLLAAVAAQFILNGIGSFLQQIK